MAFGVTGLVFGFTSTAAAISAGSAAATSAALQTGEGRQFIQRAAHEFFDDVLGLSPRAALKAAQIITPLVLNAAIQGGLGKLVTRGQQAQWESFDVGTASDTDIAATKDVLQTGGGKNFGDHPVELADVVGVLRNGNGNIVAVAGAESLGGQHLGVVVKGLNVQKTFEHFPNLTDGYGIPGISHTAFNASLLEAGYSNAILGMGVQSAYVSNVVYGPYGGGLTNAALVQHQLDE